MVFLREWRAAYEASPPGTQAANQLDTRIQEVKKDIRERFDLEHYLDLSQGAGGYDGVHKFPSGTKTNRDNIGTPKDGNLFVRTDTRSIDVYNGTDWIEFMAWKTGDMKMAAYDDNADIGWLKCDGAAVSRTGIFQDLFDLIGVEYGVGDGSTTFNVPKMDGKFPIGIDSGDSDFDAMGETGGDKTKTLIEADLPAHTHPFTTTSDGDHTHTLDMKSGGGNATDRVNTASGSGGLDAQDSGAVETTGAHTHGGTTDSTGDDGAHDVMNPFIAMQWYIRL